MGSKRKCVQFVDEEVMKGKAPKRWNGLEATVIEMMKNYEPTSMHKRPFWCRVCQFQGTCLEEFNAHLHSDEHEKASKLERKMSLCKLCKKQFTSPEQLREHLSGKAHKEMLIKIKGKNTR